MGQSNEDKSENIPFYHRPLWVGIILLILGILTAIYVYRMTQGKEYSEERQRETQKIATEVTFEEPVHHKDSDLIDFPIQNEGEIIYTSGEGNPILSGFVAEDEEGNILPINVPDKIDKDGKGVVTVDSSGAVGEVKVTVTCTDNFGEKDIPGYRSECIPKGIDSEKIYELPNYNALKFLGIDASYADDNIDFSVIKKYLKNQGAIFYGVQSPGKEPDKGVLRIDANTLFKGKKILFALYNDNKEISESNLESIKKDLLSSFTHLEEIRFYSFTDYYNAMNIQSEISDIRHIFGAIGDCNLKAFGRCSSTLYETGKYPLFTKNMITNDIDILFIVPAVLTTKRLLGGTSGTGTLK